MLTIALMVLAAVALQQPAAPAAAPAPAARELQFCTQHGPVFVRLQGHQGAGVYSILGNGDIGAFVGTLDGRTLEGRWHETDSRGDIRITFAEGWTAIALQYRSDGEAAWRGDWDGVPPPADGSRSVKKQGVDYLCGRLTADAAPR
jgi:hypothetical protein